jgi:chaperonin GroEL
MSSKQVKFGKESRDQLMEGINILADAVSCTLGPNGRNVLINRAGYNDDQKPIHTKDGVTVAKNIIVDGLVQNLGAQMVKQASITTADKAGDGTTTSTVLAREMISEGLGYLNDGENAVEIKRDIEAAVKEVIGFIKSDISKEITSEDQLKQIATISANNDVEVGELIATAIEKVGQDGVVHIEESKSGETYLETVEGMQFDRGYKSHFFVNNNTDMSCTLNNPYVLIADYKFTAVKDLLPILQNVSSNNRDLLIIADDIEGEALATLIVNKARGMLNVAAVKAPDFGDRKKLILEDIATVTGGTVFDKDKGMKLDKFSWDWFGEARTITITKNQTTIVDGKGEETAINTRVENLQSQIEQSETPYIREHLQNRLAKMIGGVSIIHVGGLTETEIGEKKDRVDDALHATKAALSKGIVPGGGAALLYASKTLKAKSIGYKIVIKACRKPFIQILENAGFDYVDARIMTNTIQKGKDNWVGYDIKRDLKVNMLDAGIIDPTKVTCTALLNAASVAGTILLTECVVVESPEKDGSPQPQQFM